MTVGPNQEKLRRRQSNIMSRVTYPQAYGRGRDGDFDFDDMGLSIPIPREFQVIIDSSVPILQNNDDTTKDFIILCECSEKVGPMPLCTIPPSAADKTDINLTSFTAHIMSTDYVVGTIGQFRICQDTQLLRKNVFKGVHVFTQYVTLYDLKARGFVRPFCFGYVSKDHVKLDRMLPRLINKFERMSQVLKQANRTWFIGELTQYLNKLSKAKERFITELTPTPTVNEDGTIFSFESQADTAGDPDVITLDQIANQYSEIENIRRMIMAVNDNKPEQELFNLSEFLMNRCDSNCDLSRALRSVKIPYGPDAVQDSIEALNVPLVFPLKVKGETMRPLTTIGQLGTVHLIWKLVQEYHNFKEDLIYLEVAQMNANFEAHCNKSIALENHLYENGVNLDELTLDESSSSEIFEIMPDDGRFILDPVVAVLLEKVHLELPLSRDTDSSSYHTVSEEASLCLNPTPPTDTVVLGGNPEIPDGSKVDSHQACSSTSLLNVSRAPSFPGENNPNLDVTIVPSNVEGEHSSFEHLSAVSSLPISDLTVISTPPTSEFSVLSIPPDSSVTSSYSVLNWSPESTGSTRSNREQGSSSNGQTEAPVSRQHSDKSSPPARYSLSSCTSEEENLGPIIGVSQSSEETIKKRPWWAYATDKGSTTALSRGQPGYGLLNFFRHYHKIAHHTLYSILLGRPIIVCGNVEQKPKITRIINSLIPLIPSLNDWKVLKWHQGILVHEHLREFKLIGLCIPERLSVQDLLSAQDENYVTILNVQKKRILGPAYSGDFLKPFELDHLIQKNFYKSDATMLTYIGSIFSTIETKLYMYKSLEDKNSKKVNLKQLSLKGSDADILRYLGSLIPSPDQSLILF